MESFARFKKITDAIVIFYCVSWKDLNLKIDTIFWILYFIMIIYRSTRINEVSV